MLDGAAESMNLNLESNRLRTFDIWPLGVYLADPQQWARNGFFAIGEVEAECNWCHQRFSAVDCDQIEEQHRILQPLCGFVLDPRGCGNVPLESYSACNQQVSVSTFSTSSIPTTSTESVQANVSLSFGDLLIEANRLATFKNWPNPNISPESLAKAGFFYLNRSDEVKCAWCKGVIAKWEKQDIAFEEHKRFFPDCPRVQLGPLIDMASDGIRDLGIQQIAAPKKPFFSSLDTRLRTYENWPIGDIQQPEALALAGLYYQNVDDQVRCFHCNIGLRSWQKDDDPWFEHAKWLPQCHFVRLVKGPNYVRHVQDTTRQIAQSLLPSVADPCIRVDETMSIPPFLQTLESNEVENITNSVINVVHGDYTERNSVSEISSCLQNEQAHVPPVANLLQNTLCQTMKGVSADETKIQAHLLDPLPNNYLSLEEENRKLKDARLCKVCLDEEVGVVFLPCGHLVTCVQCAPGVKLCPMCRTAIKGFVRTYLS